VGQTIAHGAGLHARQDFASKPVAIPPEEAIRMPVVFQDKCLCTSLAQANEQE
jgi:hypothetical protein